MADRTAPKRFLALGDSYTVGEGVDPDDRWPAQLRSVLIGRGVRVAAPTIVARTGWTTDELGTAIETADLEPPYDLVTLLIGANDQYRGRSIAEYREGFARNLEAATRLAGDAARVLVGSIPDWGVTPFAAGRDRVRIAAAIDRYNEENRRAAMRSGARYVDVTIASREDAAHPGMLAADGLHYSASMYARWARVAAPAATAILMNG